MADRSTPRFYEDSFGRDDSADLGGNWSQNGTLQIVNQTLRQSGATAVAAAYAMQAVSTAASDCGSRYVTEMKVACAAVSTTARKATLLLRFQGVPASGDGYGVTLEWQEVASAEVLTLRIRKCLAGTWADLSSTVVTTEANMDSGDSVEGVYQNLSASVYDVEGDVVIEAGFNGEGSPRATYTDKEYPLYRSEGSFGAFHEDNNAGVDGYILVASIALQSIQEEDTAGSIAYLWSFGEIKRQVRTHARRDSQDTLDDTYWSNIINESLQEFALHHLPAWWWEERVTLNLKAGQTEVILAPNIVLFDDNAFDTTNNCPRPIVRVRDYEQYPYHPSTPNSGQVQTFLSTGRGHGGGITFAPRPLPQDNCTFTLTCWRQPAILVNDDQIPDLPESLIPGLIWGAVYLYTLRDSDRTHINSARDEKAMWFKSAMRLRNRFHSLSAPQTARSGFRIQSAMSRAFGKFGS